MYGDFSRVTFAPDKHFSAVLGLQGRVTLEADSNENTAIQLHHLRTMARDLIGPHGGPIDAAGFAIAVITDDGGGLADLAIGPGRYYVDGILAENDELDEQGDPLAVTYYNQPDAHRDPERAGDQLPSTTFLVALRVSEATVTSLQDESIREVALGPYCPDTAARARIVWQLVIARTLPNGSPLPHDATRADLEATWADWVNLWQSNNRGQLKARARQAVDASDDPCIVSPEARYRGHENQLYRVEIHTGGPAATATFKWSRENGSVAFGIEAISGVEVNVTTLGRDRRLGLTVGDWVEVVDDASVARGEPEPLRQIVAIDGGERRVTLDAAIETGAGHDPNRHPLLRRWDQAAGNPQRGGLQLVAADNAARVVETTTGSDGWLHLEDGVQVQFQPGGAYRHGDYWLIPARVETGEVEWPGPVGAPSARPPHGVDLHFAPLALVRPAAGGSTHEVVEIRSFFAGSASSIALVDRLAKLEDVLLLPAIDQFPLNATAGSPISVKGRNFAFGQPQVTFIARDDGATSIAPPNGAPTATQIDVFVPMVDVGLYTIRVTTEGGSRDSDQVFEVVT